MKMEAGAKDSEETASNGSCKMKRFLSLRMEDGVGTEE